ncbi:hypothetical protein NBRC110019_16390 [Neptunitalea chrysea]|uniref:Uncharacterized protein n=1 Tax=Neptunitalea chrysea TaxID=1647581 RepID=A0A9W6B4V4_9FLAO|nr:hypothetical protein [Neptunitalea chrysea]GLB52599.1 hypothetical protein NBRC110019_16390 [Neptunitalea chrysea]
MKRKDFLKGLGALGATIPVLSFTKTPVANIMDEPSNNDLLFDCTETPSETSGPYPTPNTVTTSTLVRTDITESTETGIPLTLTITISGISGSCGVVGS